MQRQSIPVLDLGPEIDSIWDELQTAFQSVLRSGHFILGPNVQAFEDEIAEYLGVKHAIGMNSGTDALFIALKAAGLGPGDEVITTPFTFFATAEAVSHVGATPVFVDVDILTFNLDVRQVEKVITPRTKAIIPVHLYGQVVDMRPLMMLAEKYHLKVIEDVAQALGGEYLGSKAGTMGLAGTFSFFPSKNLGAFGDAGLLATDNDSLAESARMLRAHGSRTKYYNEVVGYNSRLDELQAALLRVKLPYLDTWNEGRRLAAQRYHNMLSEVSGLITPIELPGSKHVFHQYTVRIMDNKRDHVRGFLADAGISTMIYYPVPLHQLPIYKKHAPHLPVAERLSGEVLSLPLWPSISEDTQGEIAEQIRRSLQ